MEERSDEKPAAAGSIHAGALRRSDVLRLVFDTAALHARDCLTHSLLIAPPATPNGIDKT